MSGTNVIPGSFDKPFGLVAAQFARNGRPAVTGVTDKTTGMFAAKQLVVSPTGTELWEVTGFSVQVRMAAFLDVVIPAQYWAKFGDIWAGVLKDFPLPTVSPAVPGPIASGTTWPPVEFPSDLSTFTKIWNGAEDDIAVISAANFLAGALSDPQNYTLISMSTVLPFPIQVRAGTQLAFAVIQGVSILDAAVGHLISDIEYAVNYNTRKG